MREDGRAPAAQGLVKAWQTDRVAREVPALTARDGDVLTLAEWPRELEKLGPRTLLGVTEQGATLVAPGRVSPGGRRPTHVAGPEFLAAMFRAAVLERARDRARVSAPRSRGEARG